MNERFITVNTGVFIVGQLIHNTFTDKYAKVLSVHVVDARHMRLRIRDATPEEIREHLNPTPHFSGSTYNPEEDHDRLAAQLYRVKAIMADSEWHDPSELVEKTGDNWASVSARLRDLRKKRFGEHDVQRMYIGNGLHRYRVIWNAEGGDVEQDNT